MVFMAIFWVLVVVGTWLGARLLRSRAQERRRRHGSAADVARRGAALARWSSCSRGGCSWRSAGYAIVRNCHEDSSTTPSCTQNVSADEYCSAVLQEYFPGTLVAVSLVFAGAALVWTSTVLLLRAVERRHARVS